MFVQICGENWYYHKRVKAVIINCVFHGKRLDRMGGCFILYLCWKYVNDYKSTTSITLIKHFISVVSKPVIDSASAKWQRASAMITTL